MTAPFLASQLTSLIQESKKKNIDLRNAAEKSLGDLKALPTTSEIQLASDLRRRPNFIRPFLLACASRNTKLTSLAASCLQKLATSAGLPPDRLTEVLDAFHEAIPQNTEVQLKILQALPPMLQNYPSDLRGDAIGKMLLICSELQGSKAGVVHGTATATLQQLVVAMYEKVTAEDEQPENRHGEGKVQTADGEIQVRAAAMDIYKIFDDICLLTRGQKPQFLRIKGIAQTTGLELIEAVLGNHHTVFSAHPEQVEVLRRHVMPLVVKIFAERSDFAPSVRAVRVFSLILRHYLSDLSAACGEALETLTRLLENESVAMWRRALALEVWRAIYSEFGLVRELYSTFDQEEGQRDIVRTNLAKLARLAAERPDVIGLGQQSGVAGEQAGLKDQSSEQVAMEAGGVGGIITGAVTLRSAEPQGISVQSSSVRIACIDQLDKTDPPTLPDPYIYSLVLMCIGGLAEGLAKFVLPLTVPTDRRHQKRSRKPTVSENGHSTTPARDVASSSATDLPEASARPAAYESSFPTNPMSLQQHHLYPAIQAAVAMIEDCWPAILATCSTFLYATLDHGFFRALIRSFQKLTHVSGLVRLKTPRDAFLTTLSKAAVPHYHISSLPATPTTPGPKDGFGSLDGHSFLSPLRHVRPPSNLSTEDLRETGPQATGPSLSSRNLLCLRGLLNIGIALGPILDEAWAIIVETWQQASFIISVSLVPSPRSASSSAQVSELSNGSRVAVPSAEIQGELSAIDAAGSRLLESTDEMPDEAFVDLLNAFSKILNLASKPTGDFRSPLPSPKDIPQASPSPNESSPTTAQNPAVYPSTSSQTHAAQFCLHSIGALVSINMRRLILSDPSSSGLKMLVARLVSWASSPNMHPAIRLKSAEILNTLVREAATSSIQKSNQATVDGYPICLYPLHMITQVLRNGSRAAWTGVSKVDAAIQKMSLESLKVVLEHSGETLEGGWDVIFDILGSIFETPGNSEKKNSESVASASQRGLPSAARFSLLMRPAFSSVQLVCSDFLASLPSPCILALVDILVAFCAQHDDLNISLTSVTLLWQVSTFLQDKPHSADANESVATAEGEAALRREAVSTNGYSADMALWMVLLRRLTALAVDERPDIRNGVIQSIFRMFDGHGDQLSSTEWQSCLQFVVLGLIEQNLEQQKKLLASSTDDALGSTDAWDETTINIIHGLAGLFSNYARMFLQHEHLRASWPSITRYFERILAQQRLGLTLAVFRSLQRMLASIESPEQLEASMLESIWSLWLDGIPAKVSESSKSGRMGQEVLVAYIQAFKELHRLKRHHLTDPRILDVIQSLHQCITVSDGSVIATASESLSPLQNEVLASIQLLLADIPGVPSAVIDWLSRIILLPFGQPPSRTSTQQLRYVALAKKSMEIIQSVVLEHVRNKSLYIKDSFENAIGSLAGCISRQPSVRKHLKDDALGTTAISSALTILSSAIPAIHAIDLEKPYAKDVWRGVVDITQSILGADTAPEDGAYEDPARESYDVNALSTLRKLACPGMGSSVVLEDTRQAYCECLFQSSLIHRPEPSELFPSRDQVLEGLYDIRMGRTYDPPPSRRIKTCYVCLDELFALVAKHDGSAERVRLAQAASPFLILRAALPLRSYIADQPLRGHMPQPLSQRRELLDILQKLIALECEPRAIPDAPGVISQHKKHLHRIFPFIGQAIRVARQDQELLNELCRVAEMVGDEMGVGS